MTAPACSPSLTEVRILGEPDWKRNIIVILQAGPFLIHDYHTYQLSSPLLSIIGS